MNEMSHGSMFVTTKPLVLTPDEARIELLSSKIANLEMIRNHLDYALRYEHRFHAFDIITLKSALHKIQLVIDMYNVQLDNGNAFWGLDKSFFRAFDWIEQTFRDDLASKDTCRISVIYIYHLDGHLRDLTMMFNESVHRGPSVMSQMWDQVKSVFGK